MRKFLLEHAAQDPVAFHMPGHKGADIFRRYGYGDFLDALIDCDITEIPGADNLFQAEGIIKEAQDRYSRLYDVEQSYLLVNGTSGGILASVLASVRPGGRLVMARNCHKSVFNALSMGGISPVYAKPEFIGEYGIMGAVSPEEIERCLTEYPDADAVILPSPNYYGICSDIKAIAEVVHRLGKTLVVDQAHGAHLKFFHRYGCGQGMAQAAEDCGADIVINSIHKTLVSVTQSAVLNLNSDRVDRYVLEDKLQAVQSSSPSYLMMAFLDINADILEKHGRELIKGWRDDLLYFRKEASSVEGLDIIDTGLMDITKINLNMRRLGIDGGTLEDMLMEKGIFSELHTGDILMFMTGIGNTRKDMDRALAALRQISAGHRLEAREGLADTEPFSIPPSGRLFRVPDRKTYVHLGSAAGRICAGSVIPYPPGIPIACPGEEITEDIVEYIRHLRKEGGRVIGLNDREEILAGV